MFLRVFTEVALSMPRTRCINTMNDLYNVWYKVTWKYDFSTYFGYDVWNKFKSTLSMFWEWFEWYFNEVWNKSIKMWFYQMNW